MTFMRALCLAILCSITWLPTASAAPKAVEPPASFDKTSVYVFKPKTAPPGPQPVLVALHGMDMEGKGFCQGLLATAERNGWIVVAPTFKFRDWRDPQTVAEDDIALTEELVELLDGLPERVGHPIEERVFLLGYSRGAQLAHRFAFAHPERTRGVAAVAAGTYTMPSKVTLQDNREVALAFPFGIADLASRLSIRDPMAPSIVNLDSSSQPPAIMETGRPPSATPTGLTDVPFWIAVGAEDKNPDDVPRQWDDFGRSRLERAMRFARALQSAGINSEYTVFGGVGHAITAEMTYGALAFMERIARGQMFNPTALLVPEVVAKPVAV